MTDAEAKPVDVAIVGGGIIGCMLAYELTRKGQSVALIEQGSIAREASWASAGIIAPSLDPATPEVRVTLTDRGIRGYPWLVATVQEETGIDVGYRQNGELVLARDEAEAAKLREGLQWQLDRGFDSEWVEADDLKAIEPVLPDGLHGALLQNDSGSLIVHRLCEALARAASFKGAAIAEQTPAIGIATEGKRATGVRIAGGMIPAGQVVLAAGAWTARFGLELGVPIPTVPVKGEMLALAGMRIAPSRIISADGYLVPRTDGTVAVAATKSWSGFDKRVTPEGLRSLLDILDRLGPSLGDAEVVATWAGLRPGTSDGESIVGAVPGYDNLWVATGHFRWGVQVAIGTIELLVPCLLGEAPDPLLSTVSPTRFARATT